MIRKGDIITFKPQWMDKGDENFTFIARSDEEKGRFEYSAVEHRTMALWPWSVASVDMVASVRRGRS